MDVEDATGEFMERMAALRAAAAGEVAEADSIVTARPRSAECSTGSSCTALTRPTHLAASTPSCTLVTGATCWSRASTRAARPGTMPAGTPELAHEPLSLPDGVLTGSNPNPIVAPVARERQVDDPADPELQWPRTSTSLLRGSVTASARTSSTVTGTAQVTPTLPSGAGVDQARAATTSVLTRGGGHRGHRLHVRGPALAPGRWPRSSPSSPPSCSLSGGAAARGR